MSDSLSRYRRYLYKREDGTLYVKICEGCKTYEEGVATIPPEDRKKIVYLCNVSIPFIQGDPNICPGRICPCAECLVKMVCNVKCEELENHITNQSIKIGDEKR